MITTHNSSFLRAGSKFKGTQQSDKQKYNVEVDIKSVNMAESELCGYLRIEGEKTHGRAVEPFKSSLIQASNNRSDAGARDTDDIF